jgi:hypothetical protein
VRVNYSEHVDLYQYRLLSKCIECCAYIEEVPMRILAGLTILTMSMALAGGQARAQTYDPRYPVCMAVVPAKGGSVYYDCSYYTMAQCTATASGRGAQCDPNPYYAGATASSRKSGRERSRN